MASLHSTIRKTLNGMRAYLEREFARGRVWYESDLHRAALFYLTRELVERDERWVVGAQHWVGSYRPDIVCYHRGDNDYEAFLRDPERAVRAIVELKFASRLGHDLRKLRTLQRKLRKNRPAIVAWMVYGDHFDSKIHSYWASKQAKRKAKIVRWRRERPSTRGRTMIECGKLRAAGALAAHSDVLAALNNPRGTFWKTKRAPRKKSAKK